MSLFYYGLIYPEIYNLIYYLLFIANIKKKSARFHSKNTNKKWKLLILLVFNFFFSFK